MEIYAILILQVYNSVSSLGRSSPKPMRSAFIDKGVLTLQLLQRADKTATALY